MQKQLNPPPQGRSKYSILNDEYYVTDYLGEGTTSRVYRYHAIKDPAIVGALKLIRSEFI